MTYKIELTNFAKNIRTLQKYLKSRDTVRQSLVVPFFKILGWDVYNPGEFMAGYTYETPQGDVFSADFAVLKNDQPAIFVQTFFGDEDPAEGHANLAALFYAVPGDKVAILTNGVDWRFYTDGVESGILDATPYLELNLGEKTRAEDLAVIDLYQKEGFDLGPILAPLRLGVYEKKIAEYFVAQRTAATADKELMDFIIKKVGGTELAPEAKEKLAGWVVNGFAVIPPKNTSTAPTPQPAAAPKPIPALQELSELEMIPLKGSGKPMAKPASKPAAKPVETTNINLEALPDTDESTMEGRVTIISGDDQGKTVSMQKKEFIVGRNLDLDLVLTDPSVSRRHFRIFLDGGRYWVEDLGSGNKIKVNGVKTTEKKRLENDDLIQAGNTTIRFESYQ
ncbi:MAG TPA: FHA domain-containing protein [bacterium]|nr:FHA domain-containing protein [bacterium]